MNAASSRAKVVARIADHLVGLPFDHPLRVAVDGPTAAGKTTLAAELSEAVSQRGSPAIHLSMDGFHHPRAHRHRRGTASAVGYYQDAFDFESFRTSVLDPLGPGGDHLYRQAIHDVATDEGLHEPAIAAPADAVLIVDGTFLQRDLQWDEVVYLDVPFDIARERGVQRDSELFGGVGAANVAYRSRYHGACALYLDEIDPRSRATILVDNNDVTAPVLRRIGGTPTASVQLFSYGTLQQRDVQLATFGRELSGSPGVLPGHRTDWVTITDPDVIAASGSDRHPLVRPSADPSDSVAGTVFTVTPTELAAADNYEVDDYRRFSVQLASGARAWVYLAAEG